MRWVLVAVAVAVLGIATVAIWHAVHSPAFWGNAIVAIASLIGGTAIGAIASGVAKDFADPKIDKEVKDAARQGRERTWRGGPRHPDER